MWQNFVDAVSNLLFQCSGGCALHGIDLKMSNNPAKRSAMLLNHLIQDDNFDHRNERVHDQRTFHAPIGLFRGMYGIRHGLIEIRCRSYQYRTQFRQK